MKDCYYTVGQLAAICDVSVQTLRYYDKINLLKPSKINENNSYRLYSDTDILTLRIIRDMKEIGLSLEEINEYLRNDNSDFALNLLENKKREYNARLSSVNFILNTISERIDKLKLHDTAADSLTEFSKTIEIKQLSERYVAFTRYHSDCYHETLAKRFFELDRIVKEYNIQASGSRLAVHHDFLKNFDPEDCDLEICLPVSDKYSGEKFVHKIDQGIYATGIYKGEYIGQCSYLATWIKDQGYEITGPGIEIYIHSFMNTRFPKNYVTEVQFPIKKY